MTGFLLDTNTISEAVQFRAEPKVIDWLEAADERKLFVSVLVLGEIRKGASKLGAGARRSRLEHWLDTELPARFAGRVLSVDASVADRWGRITSQAQARGFTLAVIDGLLAATAFENGLTLVTRNVRDFAGLGIELLNPWEHA